MIVAGLLLAAAVFTPPRLVAGSPPGLPPVTVVGGGEALVEATVDRSGTVTHAVLLRNTPPFGQMVLDAVRDWHFSPAHAVGDDGRDQPVEASVLIAAVYRPPTLLNGPTLGTPAQDLSKASTATPYPVMMPMPGYPPQAAFGGVVMLEVSLDEAGTMKGMTTVRSDPAFDAAARAAVSGWQFRGASLRSSPVPSTVYVIVGFPQPVLTPPSR